MEGQVDVRARSRDDLRCPLCLDALDSDPAECAACATPHHAACLRELGGCALLGCKGAVDVAPPDRERAAIQARAQQRARRFVKGEGLGDVAEPPARPELRPDLRGDQDPERRFWWAERVMWTFVFTVGALLVFAAVLYLGARQGWPRGTPTLNAAVAAVVVGICGLFVVHARAPQR